MAAAHCGFTQGTFEAMVRRGFLPCANPSTGGWEKAALDQALEKILEYGLGIFSPPKATHITIPNCQHLPRRLVDGTIRWHMRHRLLGRPLPADWKSPEFAATLIACERELAAQQQAKKPTNEPPAQPHNQSPSPPQQSQHAASATPEFVTQKGLGNEPKSHAGDALKIPRRKSQITQADIARIIRAAKQTGAAQVEVRLNDSSTVVIRLQPSGSPDIPLAPSEEIVL